MADREKLIKLIGQVQYLGGLELALADHLIANGVTFATDNNVGNKRIEELEAKLAEREEAVCNLRKKWQAAETHICTMCGHFDHKTDGNIVYGNKNCGELVGYPCCEKFTPWIPVTDRLPKPYMDVITLRKNLFVEEYQSCGLEYITIKGIADIPTWSKDNVTWKTKVTHWMPLPEPPKGE